MKNMKRILAAVFALCMLLTLIPFAAADNEASELPADEFNAQDDDILVETVDMSVDYETMFAGRSWDEVVAEFIASYQGIGEKNVMLGYYNLVTGEEHYVNPDIYTDAASTYKVPLNMLYAEKIAAGEMSLDSMVGAYMYSELLQRTIVDSNNELAEVLWSNLGGYNAYRHMIPEYMGEDPETVDPKFYVNNYITARQALTCLVTLYENEERFPNIIDTMKQAEPEKYFRAEETRFEIAHKYGYNTIPYHYYINDTAIIYTDDPIVIVYFSDNVAQALDMMAKYCTLMCDYTQYHTAERRAAEEEAAAMAAEEAAAAEEAERIAAEEEAARLAEEQAAAETEAEKVSAIAAPEAVQELLKTANIPELSFGTFVLLVLSLAVGLVIFILVIANHRKVGMLWGLIAAVLITLTLIVCIIGNTVGTLITGGTEGDPRDSVTAFFDALTLGDYPSAYEYLEGYTTLGLENKPEGDAAVMIQRALEQSYSYQLAGDVRIDGISAEQDVDFIYLDLSAIDEKVQAITPDKLEELVAANPLSKVYDENNQYRPEITQQAYINALKEVLNDAESCYISTTLTVSLDYVNETWLIAPDQTLFRALLGGITY